MRPETRASVRVRVLSPAHFRRDGKDRLSFATVVVVNVAGCYLATNEALGENEEIDLALALPGSPRAFRSRARVVSSRTAPAPGGGVIPGVGCAFLAPPEELVAAIHALPA